MSRLTGLADVAWPLAKSWARVVAMLEVSPCVFGESSRRLLSWAVACFLPPNSGDTGNDDGSRPRQSGGQKHTLPCAGSLQKGGKGWQIPPSTSPITWQRLRDVLSSTQVCVRARYLTFLHDYGAVCVRSTHTGHCYCASFSPISHRGEVGDVAGEALEMMVCANPCNLETNHRDTENKLVGIVKLTLTHDIEPTDDEKRLSRERTYLPFHSLEGQRPWVHGGARFGDGGKASRDGDGHKHGGHIPAQARLAQVDLPSSTVQLSCTYSWSDQTRVAEVVAHALSQSLQWSVDTPPPFCIPSPPCSCLARGPSWWPWKRRQTQVVTGSSIARVLCGGRVPVGSAMPRPNAARVSRV